MIIEPSDVIVIFAMTGASSPTSQQERSKCQGGRY
jgi:hypothetical protein